MPGHAYKKAGIVMRYSTYAKNFSDMNYEGNERDYQRERRRREREREAKKREKEVFGRRSHRQRHMDDHDDFFEPDDGDWDFQENMH
jgi:hypothetical protein